MTDWLEREWVVWLLAVTLGVLATLFLATVWLVFLDDDPTCQRLKALAAEGNELAAVEAVKRCD